MEITSELFKIAYKKLKSSLYYDKTMGITREELVKYEMEGDIDKKLEKLHRRFIDDKERDVLFYDLLDRIDYLAFPKSVDYNFVVETTGLVSNFPSNSINLGELQYYIHLDIEGHILGVVWLLLIGYKIDSLLYEHSYGNRIRKDLINELSDKPTYSPYLFEPYFRQYENWRDKALSEAKNQLSIGNDAYVLTLDLKRFYYSLNISQEFMKRVLDSADIKNRNLKEKSLNTFIFNVICRYSSLFEDQFEGRNILPIGFLPSNVLANYALRNLDEAISNYWNPLYYGRYVDDIIIVDKVESNSYLYNKCRKESLSSEELINRLLKSCREWEKGNKKNVALIINQRKDEDHSVIYHINPLYNPVSVNDGSLLELQEKKLKFFYFRTDCSDAMINDFINHVRENKSEFRHIPDIDFDNDWNDINKIFDIKNNDTINKFRGISKVSINKFELSKFLGRYLRTISLIDDPYIKESISKLKKALNSQDLLENYTLWDQLFEVYVLSEAWDDLAELVNRIIKSIIEIPKIGFTQKSLYLYLKSSLNRSLSLVWGEGYNLFIQSMMHYEYSDSIIESAYDDIRYGFLSTRMLDQSLIPVVLDCIDGLKLREETHKTINLSRLDQVLPYTKLDYKSYYKYNPVLVPLFSYSILNCFNTLNPNYYNDRDVSDYDNYRNYSGVYFNDLIKDFSLFSSSNFNQDNTKLPFSVKSPDKKSKNIRFIDVKSDTKDRIKIALANIKLDHEDFGKIVIGKPVRTKERYKAFVNVVNAAIEENVDMLVFPESYLPFEWLNALVNKCIKNNMAVITGIEHIIANRNVFNLSAIVLPFQNGSIKDAVVSFHLKTNYAPEEKSIIESYRLKVVEGNVHELYKWHGCYFPFYCCYELASIVDRSIYLSVADFLVAIEWNHDVNYYSNIIESLSRDLHCYCIQDNYSDYGDSRITKPSKTESKDIIRVKGGINSTILVDYIDINELRLFQIKGYYLQKNDKSGLKPTPPGFKADIVLKKLAGEDIFDYI